MSQSSEHLNSEFLDWRIKQLMNCRLVWRYFRVFLECLLVGVQRQAQSRRGEIGS
jgi:hypothetical protein